MLRQGCLRRAGFRHRRRGIPSTCTIAKTDRALDRKIALGSDFLPASHVRPNFDLNRRPGRSDAPPGSQGDVSALLNSLCPNIRLALQAINAPIPPPSLFRPADRPAPFVFIAPSILPLAAGKAGNPKKWTVGFRRRGATHARRNSFARTSAQCVTRASLIRWIGRSIA